MLFFQNFSNKLLYILRFYENFFFLLTTNFQINQSETNFDTIINFITVFIYFCWSYQRCKVFPKYRLHECSWVSSRVKTATFRWRTLPSVSSEKNDRVRHRSVEHFVKLFFSFPLYFELSSNFCGILNVSVTPIVLAPRNLVAQLQELSSPGNQFQFSECLLKNISGHKSLVLLRNHSSNSCASSERR